MAKKYKHLIWNNLSLPIGWSYAAHKKAGGYYSENSGVDMATPRFTLCRLGWDGVVYAMKKGAGIKNYVTIKHKGFFIEYVHIRDIKVKKGQKVKKGYGIGRTGVQDKHGKYLWLHLAWLQGDRYAHKNRVDPIPRLFPPKPKPKANPLTKVVNELKKENKTLKDQVKTLTNKLKGLDREVKLGEAIQAIISAIKNRLESILGLRSEGGV